MSIQDKEKTDIFLEKLASDPDKFSEFASKVSAEFKLFNGQPFTIPKIEQAMRKVYSGYGTLPPDTDLIQYEFDDLVNSSKVAIDDVSLSRHLRALVGQQRMELYARYGKIL